MAKLARGLPVTNKANSLVLFQGLFYKVKKKYYVLEFLLCLGHIQTYTMGANMLGVTDMSAPHSSHFPCN